MTKIYVLIYGDGEYEDYQEYPIGWNVDKQVLETYIDDYYKVQKKAKHHPQLKVEEIDLVTGYVPAPCKKQPCKKPCGASICRTICALVKT